MPAPFPTTQWTLLSRAKGLPHEETACRAALEDLARLYWKPIYAYLRLRWRLPSDEAADLTQQFFIGILEGRYVRTACKEKGRFRSFVKACANNLVREGIRHDRALKRGAGSPKFSIDFGNDPDRVLIARESDSPEEIVDRHWRKAVLEEALRRWEVQADQEARRLTYALFQEYELRSSGEGATYQALAEKYAISVDDVDNHLRYARKAIRNQVRILLSSSVHGPRELEEEELDFFRESP